MKRRKSLNRNYIDPRITSVSLDANALDDCVICNNKCVEKICMLNQNLSEYRICFKLPYLVKHEIAHANTPKSVKNRANGFIYTNKTPLNSDESEQLEALEIHFRGNGVGNRHDADSNHIFEVIKYGGGYFITEDKRIREKSKELNLFALSRHEFMPVLEKFEIL